MNYLEYVLIALGILSIGSILRVIIGPTIWDRMTGMNLISSKIIMAFVIFALMLDKSYLLDIAMVYALIGFLGIIMIARFVKKRGTL